ncbi:MAG: inner membrane CreD family protein [Pseudomonadota bacterium]|nr:inner membrane CreD family protein [Pseudomonadota bacterium]
MHPVLRLLGIFVVFLTTVAAWIVLGGIVTSRTQGQSMELDGRVSDLWGSLQTQDAPTFTEEWVIDVPSKEEVTDPRTGLVSVVQKVERVQQNRVVDPSRTRVDVDLHLDQRRKGLLWYPLYDVAFTGNWTYTHAGPARDLRIAFAFPDQQGLYDDFRFVVDGVDRTAEIRPQGGSLQWVLPVAPGQVVTLDVAYKSRGMREWVFRPTQGVGRVDDFALVMHTDFKRIDYPRMTTSPRTKTATDGGWTLEWSYASLVSGYGIGMVMPERVQPGELAADLSFSAPFSLALFFLWIYALGLLRGVELHPINYVFIAAAFFAFQLLFAYTADQLPVEATFALASVVSVGLVVSYLRLAVGNRFAFVEAGVAQLLYQVGFALAHFWDGFTGLTITVLGIVTLFALMQLTGRIKWSEALARKPGIAA